MDLLHTLILSLATLQPPSLLRFTFTRTRQASAELQFSELYLFDALGTRVPVTNVSSPGGSWSNENQAPAMVFDGNLGKK